MNHTISPKFIRAFSLPLRLGLLLIALLAGRFAWQDWLASTLIEFRADAASRALAVAQTPLNPRVWLAQGKRLLAQGDPTQTETALASLQHAAQLAPADYRYALELGHGHEAAGQSAAALGALQQAVRLAPRYFETHWALANAQLRAGRRAEALPALRTALSLSGAQSDTPNEAAAQSAYQAIVGAFGNDFAALDAITGESETARAQLAYFLARPEFLDLALTKWAQLPARPTPAYRKLAVQLLNATERAGRYADEQKVWQTLLAQELPAAQRAARPDNLLFDGSFEQLALSEQLELLRAAPAGFDWRSAPHGEARAQRTELERFAGNYALRLRLTANLLSDFRHVTQLIPLPTSADNHAARNAAIHAPRGSYQLQCQVKADEWPVGNPAYLELTDAQNDNAFQLALPLPVQTRDWQPAAISFTIPPATRALRLRLRVNRAASFDASRANQLWLDDCRLRAEP